MKLYIWFAVIILGTICWLPSNAKAQYGGGTNGVNPNRMPDYYTNPRLTDTMLRNSLERRRREARLARNRGHKTHKRVMKKRAVRRRSHRVSILENITFPKLKLYSDLPKTVNII